MKKLIIHHQVNYNNYKIRYFNIFFNNLIRCISYKNEVILNGYSKNSHKNRCPIVLDLDDGVLVNYNKLGKAVAEVTGLNDKATKKKVKEFDWIDKTQIR
jgi:antitoxin component YwqK of YwqJK toxin-antitoxin module